MAQPTSKFVVSAEDRASATLKKIAAEFGALGKASRSASSLLSRFGGGFLSGLAGGLSVAGIAAVVKSVADLQDQFGKMAQQVGVGVQSLTELDYAAKLSDVSTEELATGLTRLVSRMGDVAQGSKEAAQVFSALGVKVKNADGTLRSSEAVLKDVAERFSQFEDGATKTAFAVEIFGRSGARLIPLLNLGRQGLADLAEEARALGVVFDEKAAKAAEEFNDNLTRLGQAAQGLKIELLQGLIPQLTEIAQRFLDAKAAGLSFGNALDIAANITGFGTLEEKIADVRRRLKDAESGKWTGWISNDVKELRAELDKLLAVQSRVQRRQTLAHPAGFSTALMGQRPSGTAPQEPRFGQSATAARLTQAALTDDQKKWVDAYAAVMRLTEAADDYARKLAILDDRYFSGEISLESYTQQLQILTKVTETAGEDTQGLAKEQAEAWLDAIDPLREFIRHIEHVDQVVRALPDGFFTPEQIAAIKGIGSEATAETEKATDAARDLGLTFQSALEDAIVEGKRFSDVLKGIEQDILRVFIRKSITEPLAQYASTAFAGMFKSHATGLDYVPYDGYLARLHRGERVMTAAENKGPSKAPSITVAPQITVNGEMSRSQEARLAVMMRNVAVATMADQKRRALA